MELRKARQSDLPQLRTVYADIVENMVLSGVDLWNEYYPYEAFPGDIEADRLWLLCDGDIIAGAFALELYTDSGGVTWEQPGVPAMTLMRLGVNPAYQRRGIGAGCVEYAKDIARERGCSYLRLFVVDINVPAERFYIKCGFVRGEGQHIEHIADLSPDGLIEYGYEIRL
ncbi:MAG: GNAT family N-acetyltransferase [Oscillospiraceae bacterium]